MSSQMTLERQGRLGMPHWPGLHGALPWLRDRIRACRIPQVPPKPAGLRVPDRVWRRQSAFIMCLYDEVP